MSAQYPELTEDLKNRSFLGMLKIFGPGAIIASVTVGSGETIFASRGGAIFGYSLLWCFVISAVLKGIQVYSGARFITLTGRHPMESWRELPGPKGWFVWFIAVISASVAMSVRTSAVTVSMVNVLLFVSIVAPDTTII